MKERIWKLIPLRKKVLVCFSTVIILIGVFSSILYHTMTETFHQCNNVYGNLRILDQYIGSIENINGYLNKYLSEDDRSYISAYNQEYNRLLEDVTNTSLQFVRVDDIVHFGNIRAMIETYGEEASEAINEYRKRNVRESSVRLSHATKVQSYIQNSMEELILSYVTQSEFFQKKFLDQLQLLRSFILLLILMSVVLWILLAVYFNRALVKPIDALVAMADKLSHGDFDVEKIKIGSYSELKMLSDTLYRMSVKIKNHVNEIKEKAILEKLLHEKERENLKISALLKETELKRLQAQVNPHFLFNTLTTLHHTAFLEGANETCEIAEAISKILRYNLRKSNTIVYLRDEIENIRHYVYIQEKRYKHRVKVSFDVDERLLDLPIPNMTVQPIVENSFIHGVENNEKTGEIEVRIYSSAGNTVIEVSDNGNGMNREKIKSVLHRIGDESEYGGHTSNIGLHNVVKRLQAFYKRRDIISIQSTCNEGTVIKLFLPDQYLAGGSEEGKLLL